MKNELRLLLFIIIGTFSDQITAQDIWKPETIQAGFYTPQRIGQIWDSWLYFYQGLYHQFYLAGVPGNWDSFELAISKDGVNWQEVGKILEPRPGTKWMGTGHIIESPDFKVHPEWIMNYSEWFGDKQDIMFAISDDLLHWDKVDESLRFKQDERWYKPDGRWDCIDCFRNINGILYGYFTADPVTEKSDHQVCGFGFAESKDGIRWTALPPIPGDVSGELGGIQKIGKKYYITVSEGRVGIADKPEGPFWIQKKNPNMFGKGCDIYFPRFFHNPPLKMTNEKNGVLVNHFYTGSDMVFSAPLKAVEIDNEGILRLKWWDQNNLLKDKELKLSLNESKNPSKAVCFFNESFNTNDVGVIESILKLNFEDHENAPLGFYFDSAGDSGHVILFNRKETAFGTMKSDGSDLKIITRICRDMEFNENCKVRLVFKRDMMEAYLDDYLVMLKRMKWSGKLAIVDQINRPKHISAWIHD